MRIKRVWPWLAACTAIVVAIMLLRSAATEQDPIHVAVLHSLTGTMAFSESPVAESTLLAIDEINQAGGLLGRPIEPILVDGRSDWATFAREAERLITQDNVAVVFGCWTSACRKTVKPIFEKHDHLLFYPVQYEGLEQSPNIIYTGAAPNQQIIPAVHWALESFGKRIFLVGSDYVFPRTANAIIKDMAQAAGASVVGERYLMLGSNNVADVVRAIGEAKPDVVFNTINGDTNIAFFHALREAGITSGVTPTMSFSISEPEVLRIGIDRMVGDYAAWNYFQSLSTPENRAFVAAFQQKYGKDRVTDDAMEAAYIGVHLWGKAVAEAGSTHAGPVRRALHHESYVAPEGIVYIDEKTQHMWKTARIGRINTRGQFDIVWTSEQQIRPVPYPIYRSAHEWSAFLQELFEAWGGKWVNPGSQG